MNRMLEMAEHELYEAVEVKNRDSLHRYIEILEEMFPKKDNIERDIGELKSEVRVLAETMKQGFEYNNKRFEDMNKRFEDMQKYMDKRFEDMQRYMDKRFEQVDKNFVRLQWFLGLGFVVLSALISLYKFL